MPENNIGDIPDNGERNDKVIALTEHTYWHEFAKESPYYEADFEKQVEKLQHNMEEKYGFTGKLLYVADKISAILMVLSYDEMGELSVIGNHNPTISKNESNAMQICDWQLTGKNDDKLYKASEIWTIDYFKTRELYKYDYTGLATAILIMYTITVKGKWYNWREKDYL